MEVELIGRINPPVSIPALSSNAGRLSFGRHNFGTKCAIEIHKGLFMDDIRTIRQRSFAIHLSLRTWALLVSRDGQPRIHVSELSGWLNGARTISADKKTRLLDALAKIESMVGASPVPLDLSTPASIEKATEAMPALLETHRQIKIAEHSVVPAPSATFAPSWPAKAYGKPSNSFDGLKQ
jgi:hypothetical protein